MWLPGIACTRAFQIIHVWHVDKLRFLGKIIDANKTQLPFRLFEAVYKRYEKNLQDYWYVGDRSKDAEKYAGLKEI